MYVLEDAPAAKSLRATPFILIFPPETTLEFMVTLANKGLMLNVAIAPQP